MLTTYKGYQSGSVREIWAAVILLIRSSSYQIIKVYKTLIKYKYGAKKKHKKQPIYSYTDHQSPRRATYLAS